MWEYSYSSLYLPPFLTYKLKRGDNKMNEEQFLQTLKEKGISLSPEQVKQFEIYFDTLVEWNNKINLTALTAKEDVYLKHFYYSITQVIYYDYNDNLTYFYIWYVDRF